MMIQTGIIAAVLLVQAAHSVTERVEVPVTRFEFSGQGQYVGKQDRRDLFQIIHPWTTSKAGDFGQMETELVVPADAEPPVTLTFYVMDNNYTGPVNTGADWINRDVRVGHRFRQALVNGQVVWQQDTCLDDVSQHYVVDISNVARPGETLKLAFRLWDAVDSDVTLPGDVYITEHYATQVATAVKQVVKDRYETKSFWGDVAVYTGAPPKPEEIPWGGQLELQPPVSERDEPPAPDKVPLSLEKSELLGGRWPWPIVQGVPFRSGTVKTPAQLALARPDGSLLPAEFTKLNHWSDGSVQWALLGLTLRPAMTGPFELCQHDQDHKLSPPLDPVITQDDLSMKNALAGIAWEGSAYDRPLTLFAADGQRMAAGPAMYLRTSGKQFHAKWLTGQWLHRSAHMAEIEAHGDLVAEDGDRYGVCRLRAAMFADCPYVRLLYTIVNQRSEPTTAVEAYGWKLAIEKGEPTATGPGWVSLRTAQGSVSAVVRWFAHLWPNGLELNGEAIDFQFFKPGDPRMPAYSTHPGEGKTQEIWLALTPDAPSADDCQRWAGLVETPPRLDVTALIRASRVWGELPQITADEHPEVYAKIEQSLAPYFENCKPNIRLFGEYSNWDNFYWNTLHTMYTLYGMTGQRKWFDWAERSVRHHFDVDICHWQPEKGGVGVVGGVHGYWGDHSDTPCYSLIQNCDGAFDHWNLTGDPDGYGYGVGIAEYVRGNPHIGSGGSTREQGWPLMCMLAAWRQTGETKYREHAQLLAEAARSFLERRRGTYIEVHGSVSYLGPTPFMYGILCTALRHYHLRTGDARAAELIACLASAVYEESHDPFHSRTLPNIDYYYSPNPYLRGPDGFTPGSTLNLNVAAAQAYGAYVLQDPGLADIARRSWQAGLDGGAVYPEMAYDLAGVVWWLDRAALLVGEQHSSNNSVFHSCR